MELFEIKYLPIDAYNSTSTNSYLILYHISLPRKIN